MIVIGLTVMKSTEAEMPLQLRKVSLTHAQTHLRSFQQKQQVSAYRFEIFVVIITKIMDITELPHFE
jgi:hypothetical protein